jgi:hypothetical protein
LLKGGNKTNMKYEYKIEFESDTTGVIKILDRFKDLLKNDIQINKYAINIKPTLTIFPEKDNI